MPNTIAVANKAIGDQRLGSLRRRSRAEQSASSSDDAEHGEDADARDRAVRRADQAGHVAADRGDHDAGDEHEDRC